MHETNLVIGLLGGISLMLAGALVWKMTGWAARGDMGSNPVAGIRTSATTASPQAWTAGHRAALPWARRIGLFGLAIGVLLVATAFLPGGTGSDGDAPHPMAVGAFAVGYGGLLLACVPLTRTANRAARQAETRSTRG